MPHTGHSGGHLKAAPEAPLAHTAPGSALPRPPGAGAPRAMLGAMIDDFAKEHLHDHLRWIREALVWKLDGLSEYDIRRPLTPTGTNLLGLVKHIAV